jgi:uncharacterized SAM-binding protein YcdF (DUF218 family)
MTKFDLYFINTLEFILTLLILLIYPILFICMFFIAIFYIIFLFTVTTVSEILNSKWFKNKTI